MDNRTSADGRLLPLTSLEIISNMKKIRGGLLHGM